MQIKSEGAVAVIIERHRLNIADIAPTAEKTCAALYAKAQREGRTITGPFIFESHGLPAEPIDLAICLPVSGPDTEELPQFRCASLMYQGPIAGMGEQAYEPLLSAIRDAGIKPTGISREVYHVCHGLDSPDNRIEIQIGIAG